MHNSRKTVITLKRYISWKAECSFSQNIAVVIYPLEILYLYIHLYYETLPVYTNQVAETLTLRTLPLRSETN